MNPKLPPYLQYLKDHLPLCRKGILKTEDLQHDTRERCMVEFVQWNNDRTISCTTDLENEEPGSAVLQSGADIPVTIKFINRKKNLYMRIRGILKINRTISLKKTSSLMAEISIDGVDFFTMKQYGQSIRFLERHSA